MPVSDKYFFNAENSPVKSGSLQELNYNPEKTHFELWAPTAEEVRLRIYDTGVDGQILEDHQMQQVQEGCWSFDLQGNYNNRFYTFEIRIGNQWLGESTGIFPIAVGVNGQRAAVIDLKETNPEGWALDRRPPLQSFSDIIIYETHQRDFSISPNSGIEYKGKFLQWTELNSTNEKGFSTGLTHLKELGITHLHVLPSFDFATVDESKLDQPQYNWGYDPLHYTVPEGSYSTDPYNPQMRIMEFKKMVQSLHKEGFRVIMDVVYNHVYDMKSSAFERTAPGYFFRMKADGCAANGSGCNSETASERSMMRKYMIESLVYWAEEYHIDGFRFDLMGMHDIKTMNAIREALDKVDPSIFLYGEGWSSEPPELPFKDLAMKENTSKLNRIACFSNEIRDGLRGGWWSNDKGAFVIGEGFEENVKFGLVGGVWHLQVKNEWIHDNHKAWANEPTQLIAYVSCHDDLCLVDRLKKTTPQNTSLDELIQLHKLAHTIVLTSQGVPFLFAGEEIFRDKKGVQNSYRSPDAVNLINWANKTKYIELFNYYKELIFIRKTHPAFHMGSAKKIRHYMRFLHVPHGNIIAYELNGKAVGDTWNNIIVIYNSNKFSVKVHIPRGSYTAVCRNGYANHAGLGLYQGSSVEVAACSALILRQ